MTRHVFSLLFMLLLMPLAQADFLPFASKKPVFLPPDQAFSLSLVAHEDGVVLANFTLTEGYYLYRDKLRFEVQNGNGRLSGMDLPKGEIKDDPNFGPTEVYYHAFQAKLQLTEFDRRHPLSIKATYQGCSEQGLCYPPQDKVFDLALLPALSAAPAVQPPPAINENARSTEVLRQGSFWLIVSFFFGAGLLLAFTPCVFPMIPILSGIIVGRGAKITHAHAFLLSLAYVLGMALTYAAAGIAAGLSGELISNALQTPWVLGSFAALFVLLSLSMFGFYELQLPSALQSRLTQTSNRLHGGHLSGVFAMGALSAVIMSPCVAAPMAGALLYIGQTHDALLGGVALFALALGMGAPLLLIGSSAATLLPKAGPWMEAVKRFFGVVMLALAIWIIMPVIPIAAQMLLWAALLIFCAIHLHVFDRLPEQASGWHKLGKAVGVFAFLLGIAYMIGALSGARDLMQPLAALSSGKVEAAPALRFEAIKGSAALDARLQAARGRQVMLDFYADWCVACKEMERYTFSDPAVQARLKDALLLRTDVTANDEQDKALLQRFQLYGPPAILFFDAQGRELAAQRVIGYQSASDFLSSLSAAGI